MNPETTALGLLPDLYEGITRGERVSNFLASVSTAIPGHEVGLALQLPGGKKPAAMWNAGLTDPAFMSEYEAYYHTVDPAMPLITQLPVGAIMDTERDLGRDVIMTSEAYNDCNRPYGMAWGPNLGAPIAAQSGRPDATIMLLRLAGCQRFSPEDLQLFELLIPHLCAARRLWCAFDQAALREQRLTEALDRMPMGVLFVDAMRRVLWASRAAETILASRDGLYTVRGELHASARQTSSVIQRGIDAAARTAAGTNLAAGGAISVSRPSGRRPLELVAAPLHGELSVGEFERRGAVAVFITDPECDPPDAQEILGALYGFTPAESRFAALLARDFSLAEAAERAEITIGNARQRLKILFEKTGTHRQSSLIRLLVRSPASLANETPSGEPK